jgi:beta-glucosidase-like glycosyl hydrolase
MRIAPKLIRPNTITDDAGRNSAAVIHGFAAESVITVPAHFAAVGNPGRGKCVQYDDRNQRIGF